MGRDANNRKNGQMPIILAIIGLLAMFLLLASSMNVAETRAKDDSARVSACELQDKGSYPSVSKTRAIDYVLETSCGDFTTSSETYYDVVVGETYDMTVYDDYKDLIRDRQFAEEVTPSV